MPINERTRLFIRALFPYTIFTLKFPPELHKIPLLILLIGVKWHIIGHAIAMRVLQMNQPFGRFQAAGWLKFYIARFNHLPWRVVALKKPGRKRALID